MDSRPPGDTMNCDLIKKETITMDKYVCDICGYVYDPAEGRSRQRRGPRHRLGERA